MPIGTKCTAIQEVLTPALPSGCTWNQPTIATLPVTIGGGNNLVGVTNSYKCDASLVVSKSVSPNPLGVPQQFPIAVTCTTTPATPPHNFIIAGNTSAPPITGLAAGNQCSVKETLPSLPFGCHWLPAVFTPSQPMT